MAQGGGQADQLTQALASAHTWLEESLI